MALLKLPHFSLPPISLPTTIKDNPLTASINSLGFGRRTVTGVGIRVEEFCRCTRVNGRFIATEEDSDSDEEQEKKELPPNDPFMMDEEERQEWRRSVREVLRKNPEEEEEDVVVEAVDPVERSKKVQEFLSKYPLVEDEEDPNWPDDADGWGFNFDQFFDKISIKNNPKKEDDDDDDKYESDNEIVWQDDNYIRPIKDLVIADWEEAVFKDISPLIILVHNRYKRPKVNEKFREQLDKAVNIIWNCRLPSPRCVAVDAIVETDLVSALRVSNFPELIFTKAGKILYREKAIRTADELSKIMAFFYYGSQKPSWLKVTECSQESIPPAPVKARP